MEPLESQQIIDKSRAKEIDTGAFPLSMENVLLGLPQKIDITGDCSSSVARPWTFAELVSQRKLINTIEINTSTPEDVPLWTFVNSWHNVQNLHFRKLNNLFLLKRWTVKFDFEVRSNFQQVGMLNISYSNIPYSLQNYISPNWYRFNDQVQLPHRFIFMGEDTNTSVSLKWISPHTASCVNDKYDVSGFQMADDYDMGTLALVCPFKMEVATGVDPTCTVRIWSSLTDVEYSAYTPHDSII